MFRRLNAKRGQNTAEYAILIGVIVAAAIAMQVYVRRGMQARIKDAVDFVDTADDDVANMQVFQNGVAQYEPYYLASNMTSSQYGTSTEELQIGGGVVRNMQGMTSGRTGNQVYAAYNEEA